MFSWADAEARFPECSAAWDRDGGAERVRDRPGLTILVGAELSIEWGTQEPVGLAIWNEERAAWEFFDWSCQ